MTMFALLALLGAAHALHAPARQGRISMQTTDMRRGRSASPATAAPSAPSVLSISSREELDGAVAAAEASGQLALVKIYAPWCRTCLRLKPRLARVARELADTMVFYEIDFSKNSCKSLCKELGVTALPTMQVYRAGELVGNRPIGIKDMMEFEAELRMQAEEMRGTYVPRDSCSLSFWSCAAASRCDLSELTPVDYDMSEWPRASSLELPNEAHLYDEER